MDVFLPNLKKLKRLLSILLLLSLNLSVFQDYFEKQAEKSYELVDIEDEKSKEEVEDNDKFFENIECILSLKFNFDSTIKNFIQKNSYINQSELPIQNPPPEFC